MSDNKNKPKREENSPAEMKADVDINTDPDGMWTGISTEDEWEYPIQDVDDL